MKKYKNKYEKTKTLKVNENNDIDSIIEIFQRFGNKYNVITTTLDPDIQYQTKNIKITQTYTSTISKTDLNKMIEKLKKQGKITLIIIEDMKENQKNKDLKKKIKVLNDLDNVTAKRIQQKDTFKILDKLIKEA
ncbi:hypothetical protein [Methanosphaera sp.]|uniref:hypothetical protein n=1 Tax=Methanosphaera sp. TaxID=2666342 RepID=UPI0025D92060|nr:hypothetical protein [Methanosphaera sp.]